MALAPCSAQAIGDANHSSCPSETESSPGFHAYLPDCRAYELVSPPFVSGASLWGLEKGEPPPMSANGEHVLSKVLGGFAETGSLEQKGPSYGALYEFSRTAAGWTAEALQPPDSLYPRSEFVFASADFSHSLWEVQVPAAPGEELPVGLPGGPENGIFARNDGTLAIREAAGAGKGRFTLVGPETAPGHEESAQGIAGFPVQGASADLSHLLLNVWAEAKQLWPGDETQQGGPSLYEYRGTGDREPVLVGVRNEGPLDGEPYLNDGAELVSRCGTVLGSAGAGGTLANAVSASGEVVYFTALACAGAPGVNELYARFDGQRTVDISEPRTGPAGDCATCDESNPSSAAFEAASEDGSKAFFTSEQELLPGARGDGLYEYDFNATDPHERLSLVAPEVTGVAAIAQDGGRVYFQSAGVLTATANGNGEVAQQGGENLYMYDTEAGEAAFTGKPVFVAQEAGNTRTTRDGQFLVFESARHLAHTNDTSVVAQLFEYDADTDTIARVSVGQTSPAGYECEITHVVEPGFNCDGNATSGGFALPRSIAEYEYFTWAPTQATSGLAVSADGAVEFESAIALTPLAVAGKENVYEYHEGSVYLISPGEELISFKPSEAPRAMGIDESGQNAFFATTASLLPQDTDSQSSWYDARQDGGFPGPVAQPACVGETCQGPLGAAPSLAAPASANAAGGGNLAPPAPVPVVKPKPTVKCRKGYVKKKGKCVKKPKGKAKKASAKRAGNNGGAEA
jgi:hypothetical protein